jgi:hypothetical protein
LTPDPGLLNIGKLLLDPAIAALFTGAITRATNESCVNDISLSLASLSRLQRKEKRTQLNQAGGKNKQDLRLVRILDPEDAWAEERARSGLIPR